MKKRVNFSEAIRLWCQQEFEPARWEPVQEDLIDVFAGNRESNNPFFPKALKQIQALQRKLNR